MMAENPCKDCEIEELCDKYDLKKQAECPCGMHRPRKGKKKGEK
jgi:hypothetical protein